MENTFELVGITIPQDWTTSNCTNHQSLLSEVEEGKVIAIVRQDKLKLFGKDENGTIRCKSWALSHGINDASLVLQQTFGVALPPVQQRSLAFAN